MRYARCECKDCGQEYMVKFDNGTPPYQLSCIICKSTNVKYTWIDRAGFNAKL